MAVGSASQDTDLIVKHIFGLRQIIYMAVYIHWDHVDHMGYSSADIFFDFLLLFVKGTWEKTRKCIQNRVLPCI